MSAHFPAATPGECALCGGPCREPFRLPPIHDKYPFLPPEVIAMTKPLVDQPPKPEPRRGRRARRPAEDTAKHPGENRAHEPSEDRDACHG